VTLTDENGDKHFTQTEEDGFYSFVVFTGDEPTTFSVEVQQETENAEDFNEGLFDTHDPTTSTIVESITVDLENSENVDFGFEPQVAELIEKLNEGIIETNTEPRIFWIKQLLFGLVSEIGLNSGVLTEEVPSEVPLSELLVHLNEIENLLQENPFQFGESKVYSALLTILRTNTELESLLAELLTAELNVVSGRGSGSLDFDLTLLAFGETAAIELENGEALRVAMRVETSNLDGMPDIESIRTLEDAKEILRQIEMSQIGSASVTVGVMPLNSSVVLEDAEPLLRSFNLSGGGGGGTIGPR
jgi:hypothetical protein